MTPVDYQDAASIDAYAKQVEQELDANAPGVAMWPLLGTWLLAGALLTLGVRFHAGPLFIAGLAVVVFSVLGFFRARGRAGWWGL